MRSGLVRRAASLFAVLMTLALAASPMAAAPVAADDNVAPTVTLNVINAADAEPFPVTALATFTDPESATETYTCTVDYGDGTVVAVAVSGTLCAGPEHHYTVGGHYTVTVTITDSGGASGSASVAVTYVNNAPYVGPTTLFGTPGAGQTLHVSVPFLDIGSTYGGVAFETYVCSFNYGDGSGVQTGTYLLLWSASNTPGCIGPDHVYAAPGTYTITSVVTDGGGLSGSSSLTQTITPNMSPVVTSPADQTVQGVPGIPSQISLGSFTDPGGAAAGPWSVSVLWGDDPLAGWGSGGTAQTQGPISSTHAYAPGTWHIQIKVTNAAGKVGYAFANVTVLDAIAVVFGVQNPVVTEGVGSTFGVFVAANGARSLPYQMHMDWGDGTSSDITSSYDMVPVNFTHTYAAGDPITAGTPVTVYNMTATVKDALGRTASASTQVGVKDVAPVITAPSYVPVAEGSTSLVTLATFTDASLGPWHVRVDLGNGETYDQVVTTPGPIQIDVDASQGDHLYPITVGDRGGLISTASVAVRVMNSAPVVGWIYADGDVIYTGGDVTKGQPLEGGNVAVDASFTDPGLVDGTETFTCAVDYGDGSMPVVGEVQDSICYGPVHKYGTSGSGVITVYVRDSNFATGSSTLPYTLVNVAPTVSAYMSAYNPREWDAGTPASSETTAYATFTDPGSATETYTCTVDYGDGTVVPGVISGLTCTGPSHQYLVSASYTVTVTVTDSQGLTGTGLTGDTYENWAPWVGGGLVGPFVVGGVLNDVAIVDDPGRAFETYTCTVDYGDGSGVQAGTYVPNGWSDGLPRCVGPDHVYKAPGSYSIITTATDSAGETGSSLVIETIAAPVITVFPVSALASVAEGSSASASAQFNPSGLTETYSCTIDYGDGTGPVAGTLIGTGPGTLCQGPVHLYSVSGTFKITVTVKGSSGLTGSASTSISVVNVAPVVASYTVAPVTKLGTAVSASATFVDPGTRETYKATWTWGDGTTTVVSVGSSVRKVSGSHVYAKAGFYTVGLVVSDGSSSGPSVTLPAVIYDPARTLAGSGSIASPAAACKISTACSKAATAAFSVSASYAKNATKPTVSLAFSMTGLSFAATGADWFVAAAGTATIQGTGKVNGVAGYTFRLTAVDGRPDAMRLQVWRSDGVLAYDNGSTTPLKTGSITIK